MKNLIVINGTMGVGKTSTARLLLKMLPRAVMLDGDWCWYADPWAVTDETKEMALANMAHLLSSFLACSEYENIIFSWVMHNGETLTNLLSRLGALGREYNLFIFALVCTPDALAARIERDVNDGVRADDGGLARALPRLSLCSHHGAHVIDTTDISAHEAAEIMYATVIGGDTAFDGNGDGDGSVGGSGIAAGNCFQA